MRHLFSAVGVVSVLALSSWAFAETPAKADKVATTTSTNGDVFDKLPGIKLELPKQANLPKSIPATEKVDGFHVEIPQHYKYAAQGPSYATIHESAEAATARNQGQDMGANPACFMSAYPNHTSDVNWSANLSTSTSVQNYSKPSYPGATQLGSVNLVRSDRIAKEDKDKLSYEVKVAYVDAETTGARLLSKQTLEFTKLSELPGRITVWGAKDDDEVTFLVRRTKHEKERHFFGALMATVNGVHSVSSSEACPVMFSLKTGKNVSTSAVVQLEALLDVVDIDADAADSEGPEGKGFLSSFPAKTSPAMGGFGQLEAKVRPMRIGLSSSWMSQDTKPVVSVSHGWSGKERTQPI